MKRQSFRTRLRAFQLMRDTPPDAGFIADLEFLENRDLDLSVRIGGMLAFNALMVTIGTHPISASPGAPGTPAGPCCAIAGTVMSAAVNMVAMNMVFIEGSWRDLENTVC